jgi:hypothetical protein
MGKEFEISISSLILVTRTYAHHYAVRRTFLHGFTRKYGFLH